MGKSQQTKYIMKRICILLVLFLQFGCQSISNISQGSQEDELDKIEIVIDGFELYYDDFELIRIDYLVGDHRATSAYIEIDEITLINSTIRKTYEVDCKIGEGQTLNLEITKEDFLDDFGSFEVNLIMSSEDDTYGSTMCDTIFYTKGEGYIILSDFPIGKLDRSLIDQLLLEEYIGDEQHNYLLKAVEKQYKRGIGNY